MQDDEENNVDVSDSENIVVATTQRPLKVRLANINEVCFTDIKDAGRKMMEKRNPEVTRFNRRMRFERKMNFYADVHASLDSTENEDDIFEAAFSRFINQ